MSDGPPPDVPLFDEEGAISREYLLWRGYCCRNGCRNCPYGFVRRDPTEGAVLPQSPPDSGWDEDADWLEDPE